jgi:hypothetical protein
MAPPLLELLVATDAVARADILSPRAASYLSDS